ncbi:hypothetical protein RYZ26_01990 [Terasakiella sp. A23]|uniref:hypothetical protein n=1 Tax=Terasakiella sp. FCG-A23 TaxID=3080561 RepID=UPI00295540CC|nr:hypothetical protein [Terasakiella sp. A23]MDV7338349.1 hypothetical protein [Terasakiella sp. A23]
MFMKKAMIALVGVCLSTTAMAAQKTRVLYMEVDEGRYMVSRDAQSFKRIFDHTGNFLEHEKIRLFEERDRSDNDRSFDDAMDIVSETKRKRLDAIVLVSVKHKTNRSNGKLKDRMTATAKVIDAKSLELVDTIRVKSPVATLSRHDCHDECREMITRRHVREILPEFKDKLADRLKDYRPRVAKVKKEPRKVTLTLKGFKPREVYHLEDHIARLDTTRDFSAMRSKPGKPAFWLERRKSAGSLRNDLSKVLANLDLQARIIETEKHVTLVKVQRDLAYLD